MAQIPLNRFVRRFTIPKVFATNVDPVYTCPSQRATIILTVQVANVSNTTSTVSLGISSIDDRTLYFLVSGYPIPVKDSVNVTLGKVLLVAGDSLLVYSDHVDSLNVSMSLLEAFNEN